MSNDNDKGSGNLADSPVYIEAQREWTEDEEHQLLRKIDTRCMPTLVLLFILNFLRGNLSNARLQGLQLDLNLTDTQYATCLSIFFAGYIFMQVPSNLILNSIPNPRVFIMLVVCVWGTISGLTALSQSFRGLVACRFWLGFVEATFYPGSIYYLSRWYTRQELGFRIACLNAGNMLAQGLGGLLAAGILSGMDGVRGIQGWRWLFIIEGVITVFFSLIIPFTLADYPNNTAWLSERERHVAVARLAKEVGLTDTPDSEEMSGLGVLRGLRLAVTDIKVLTLALTYFTYLVGLSFGAYLPTIIKGFGFSTTITLLMTFPPWAFATCFALANSWHSDRTREKFFHIALSYAFAILGYIVALTSPSVAGRYVATFGMCMGFSGGIITIGWVSSSVPRPAVKRAASIALVNGFANIGQIPATYMWPSTWGPRYSRSFAIEIVLMIFSLSLAFAFRIFLTKENKRLEKGALDAFQTDESDDKAAELVHEKRLSQSFRYIY